MSHDLLVQVAYSSSKRVVDEALSSGALKGLTPIHPCFLNETKDDVCIDILKTIRLGCCHHISASGFQYGCLFPHRSVL